MYASVIEKDRERCSFYKIRSLQEEDDGRKNFTTEIPRTHDRWFRNVGVNVHFEMSRRQEGHDLKAKQGLLKIWITDLLMIFRSLIRVA